MENQKTQHGDVELQNKLRNKKEEKKHWHKPAIKDLNMDMTAGGTFKSKSKGDDTWYQS